MQFDIVNNSDVPDDQVYIGILAQNSAGDYGYFETKAGVTAFKALSNAQSAPEQVPFYTLDTLKKSIGISDHVNSARAFVCITTPLEVPIWKDGFVGPAFTNPSLTGSVYDKIEFTFNLNGDGTEFCGCNTTAVDFFAIPMTLALKSASASEGPVGISQQQYKVFNIFEQDTSLKGLVLSNAKNWPLRVLAAGHGVQDGVLDAAYLSATIDAVWDHYASTGTNTLVLNPLPQGAVTYTSTGSVVDGVFTFTTIPGSTTHTIAKPTTQDVFYCNGVFNGVGSGESFTIDANIKNQVSSALNRGILPLAADQALCDSSKFYTQQTSNPYSATMHGVSIDNLCYGYPYDDQCNQSTYVSLNNPTTMTLTIGSLSWPA